ncbi:hypothetical protein ACXJJ3_33260 [Kribbella sp. WER1]
MQRAELVAAVRAALESCCDGSSTGLLGSLATGTEDAYSDIDGSAAFGPTSADVRPVRRSVASALANAVGAIKAVARQRPEDARGLLDRGFERIGVVDRPPVPGRPTYGGSRTRQRVRTRR